MPVKQPTPEILVPTDTAVVAAPAEPARPAPPRYGQYLLWMGLGFLAPALAWYGLVRMQVGVPTESSRWVSEIYAKKMRAARSAPSPRLLLIGGSNVLFGVRAADLTGPLGVPVINLGVHADLGVEYMLYRAKRVLRPGDTALLCFEYRALVDPAAPNEMLVDYVLSRDPGYLSHLSVLERLRFLYGVSQGRLIAGLRARFRGPGPHTWKYHSRTLDALGDETHNQPGEITPHDRRKVSRLKSSVLPMHGNAPHAHIFAVLRSFKDWCDAHHVRLLLTYPSTIRFSDYGLPAPQRELARSRAFYAGLGVPVLGAPEEFMYDRSHFFDTIYHLNSVGETHRTAQLLALLRPEFGK